MKTNIDRVYSKLPNKKHNFKNQKVALSTISELENAQSDLSSFYGAENDFEDVVKIAKNFNDFLEQIRPVARQFISEYENLKNNYDGFFTLYLELRTFLIIHISDGSFFYDRTGFIYHR